MRSAVRLRRAPGGTVRRRVVWLALAVAAGGAACDDTLVAGPLAEAGNVDVLVGATVAQSDSAVVVNGQTVFRHPSPTRALWLDRFERYQFGGFPELGQDEPGRYHRSWRIGLSHGRSEEEGDSTIFRFHDHGEVRIAGELMDRTTQVPHVPPGVPVRFDSYVAYNLTSYAMAEWQAGGSTTFVRAAFHDDLVAGRDLALHSAGSAETLPAQVTFAARPHAVLVGGDNGGALELTGTTVPVVHADRPLGLTFDRPLDPERAFLALVPAHPGAGARPAFVQPRSAAHRVVIPAQVLRQMVDGVPGKVAYRAFVIEVTVQDQVFQGRLTEAAGTPGDFGLPLVQRAETSVNLYLQR